MPFMPCLFMSRPAFKTVADSDRCIYDYRLRMCGIRLRSFFYRWARDSIFNSCQIRRYFPPRCTDWSISLQRCEHIEFRQLLNLEVPVNTQWTWHKKAEAKWYSPLLQWIWSAQRLLPGSLLAEEWLHLSWLWRVTRCCLPRAYSTRSKASMTLVSSMK